MTDVRLSPHFLLSEMTRSETALRHGRLNTPDAWQVAYLRDLCLSLLEPVRALLGVPLHVNSGFRTPAVNALVGGAEHSAHMDGRAADLYPIGMDLRTAFDRLRGASLKLPIDMAIEECGTWLHVQIARRDAEPRRQFMLASGGPGRWTYTPVGA